MTADHCVVISREIMGTDIWDVRLEDAERARARYDSNVAGLDSIFEQAMGKRRVQSWGLGVVSLSSKN